MPSCSTSLFVWFKISIQILSVLPSEALSSIQLFRHSSATHVHLSSLCLQASQRTPSFNLPIYFAPSSLSFSYFILPRNGHLYSTILGFRPQFLNCGQANGISSLAISSFLLKTLLLPSWVESAVSSALFFSPAFYTLWVGGACTEEANSSK